MVWNIYNLVYIVGNIFMAYVISKFMNIFFTEQKTSKKIKMISYIIYFIIITLLHLFVKMPIIFMISNIGLFMGLTYNYKGSFKKKLLTSFLIYLILMCVETSVVLASGYLELELMEFNNYDSILGVVMIRVISYAVVLIIGNYKNIDKGDIVSISYWLSIIIIPIGTLHLLIMVFISEKQNILLLFISVVFVLLINFVTFYLYDNVSKLLLEKSEEALIKKQNKYYIRQFELLEKSSNTIKMIKHDLKNHIISINGLAADDKKEELMEYLSKVMIVFESNDEYANTGNVCIDSIINFKLKDAKKKNININLDLNIPKGININPFDITIILGNLLDNALEALSKVEKNKLLSIKMKYTKGRLIIKIDNRFNGVIIEQDGMIVTTNKDSDNHGIGLQSVKDVLGKYNGTIDISYDINNFYTNILMYLE